VNHFRPGRIYFNFTTLMNQIAACPQKGSASFPLTFRTLRPEAILSLMQINQDVINQWSSAAKFWEKHRAVVKHMFSPVTDALVDDAQIANRDPASSSQRVLDIATGPGDPALSVAPLLGPEGRVFGVDPIPEMVAAARRAASHLGFTNAQFEVAFADHLPFPADTFDAVISRFGAMFFPSPVDAVREMLRVLKPGRKLALAVWHSANTNPFFNTVSQVIDRYVESPTPVPDAPDAFRFATPGQLREVLVDVGALAPAERLLQFNIQAPVSPEEFWTLRCELSEKLREKIALLSSEQLTEVKRQVLEAFRPYSIATGMSFPAQVLIVSGTRSPGVTPGPCKWGPGK
jgi:ubiquinone/menaquinone biosynthesis C-methylase UbiE